jgi:hypothetical protein
MSENTYSLSQNTKVIIAVGIIPIVFLHFVSSVTEFYRLYVKVCEHNSVQPVKLYNFSVSDSELSIGFKAPTVIPAKFVIQSTS